MADSGSLRVKRHRQHRAGNHSLCRPGCGGITRAPVTPARNAGVAGDQGKIADPMVAMSELAAQLKVACEANPADAVLAREYRLTLVELAKGSDGDGKDPFAELLAELAGPVPAEVGDRQA